MAFIERRTDSIGGRLLAYQDQENHRKRLYQIYRKAPKIYSSTPSLNRKSLRSSKLQQHENEQHRRNIKHLLTFISRKKNMGDRLKDPHDFFAYPALFFRQDKKVQKKAKIKQKAVDKNIKNVEDDYSEQSEQTKRYGIDLATVKRLLPVLEQFSEQQIELFNDCIGRIIMNYNINTKQKMNFLKQCVLKTSMPHYPKQFQSLVEQMFQDMLSTLEFQSKAY